MKIVTLTLGILSSSLSGAIVSVPASADTFVTAGSASSDSGSPTANYGATGALQVSASGSAKGEMQSLLRFNLAGLKTTFDTEFGVNGWEIQSITLQLGTNDGTDGTQPNSLIFNAINAGAFRVDWLSNDGWVEGTGKPSAPTTNGLTFAALPGFRSANDEALGTFNYQPVGDTNPPTVPAATYALSLGAGIIDDAEDGAPASLLLSAADEEVSYLFNSRTFSAVANRPLLIIEAVAIPEPSAAILLVGSLAVAARRRRSAYKP